MSFGGWSLPIPFWSFCRTNLELEQVDKAARNLSSSRKSCFGRYTLIEFSNVLARWRFYLSCVIDSFSLFHFPLFFLTGALIRAFQFHSQTLVSPLISVWSDLTGNDELKDSGTRYESLLGEGAGSRVRANEIKKNHKLIHITAPRLTHVLNALNLLKTVWFVILFVFFPGYIFIQAWKGMQKLTWSFSGREWQVTNHIDAMSFRKKTDKRQSASYYAF